MSDIKKDSIKEYLEKMNDDPQYDSDYIQLLLGSHNSQETSELTAQRLLTIIKERYAENKKN